MSKKGSNLSDFFYSLFFFFGKGPDLVCRTRMVDRDAKSFSAFLRKQEAAAAHKKAILLCSSNLQQFGSLQHFTSSPASPEMVTIRLTNSEKADEF
jgi:hypothetical protein